MRWTVVSAATALALTVFAFLVVRYPEYYTLWAFVGVFGAIFGFMLLRNPAYRYMRLALWIATGWLAVTASPEIKATFQIRDQVAGAFGLSNQPGWTFHLAFVLGLLSCLALDYFASRKDSALQSLFSQVHIRFGGQRQTVTGGTAILVGDVSGQAIVNVHQTDLNRELDQVKALLDKGKPDAAEEYLLRIKSDHEPSFTLQQKYRVQVYFGKVFHDRGEVAKAAVYFGNAFRLRPDDEEGQAHGLLSEYMAGRTQEVYQKAVDLLRKYPGSSLVTSVMILSAPQNAKAVTLASQIDNSVTDEVDVLAAISARYLSENDATSAETYARRVLAMRPDHPAVVGHLGIVIVDGEANEAARHFWKRPLTEVARRRLGEALGFLTSAMDTSPSPAMVREFKSARGVAREILGQFTEAEADHIAAVQVDPTCQNSTTRYALFFDPKGP